MPGGRLRQARVRFFPHFSLSLPGNTRPWDNGGAANARVDDGGTGDPA
jgi:hypothetical protein